MAAGNDAKEFGSRVELVPIPLSKRSISIVASWICIAAPLIVSSWLVQAPRTPPATIVDGLKQAADPSVIPLDLFDNLSTVGHDYLLE